MNRPWLLPALGVLALAVLIENVIFFSSGPAPASDGDEAAEAADPPMTSQPGAVLDGDRAPAPAVAAIDVLTYLGSLPDPGRARNPFERRAETPPAGSGGHAATRSRGALVLEGTLYGASRRVAWIDGVPRGVGDRVGAFEVVRIEPDAVLLRSPLRELRLEVKRTQTRAGVPTEARTRIRTDAESGSEEGES